MKKGKRKMGWTIIEKQTKLYDLNKKNNEKYKNAVEVLQRATLNNNVSMYNYKNFGVLEEDLNKTFILAYDEPYKDKDNVEQVSKKYIFCTNYIEATKLMINTNEEGRYFYECIKPNDYCFMYFDIELENDIKKDFGYSFEEIIKNQLDLNIRLNIVYYTIKTINELYNKDIDINDINTYNNVFIYNSHNENKRSWHIVFKHFIFLSNKNECLQIANIVKEKLIKHYNCEDIKKTLSCIDLSVYKSFQQIRCVKSTKVNKNRYKTFEKDFHFLDSNNNINVFSHSNDFLNSLYKIA